MGTHMKTAEKIFALRLLITRGRDLIDREVYSTWIKYINQLLPIGQDNPSRPLTLQDIDSLNSIHKQAREFLKKDKDKYDGLKFIHILEEDDPILYTIKKVKDDHYDIIWKDYGGQEYHYHYYKDQIKDLLEEGKWIIQ
jgi:hypothetical protein